MAPFAIRREDALTWHQTSREVAGIAEHSGFRIRPVQGWRKLWEVWATDSDFAAIKSQQT